MFLGSVRQLYSHRLMRRSRASSRSSPGADLFCRWSREPGRGITMGPEMLEGGEHQLPRRPEGGESTRPRGKPPSSLLP